MSLEKINVIDVRTFIQQTQLALVDRSAFRCTTKSQYSKHQESKQHIDSEKRAPRPYHIGARGMMLHFIMSLQMGNNGMSRLTSPVPARLQRRTALLFTWVHRCHKFPMKSNEKGTGPMTHCRFTL